MSEPPLHLFYLEVFAPNEQQEAYDGGVVSRVVLTLDRDVAIRLARDLLIKAHDGDPIQLDLDGLLEHERFLLDEVLPA